MAAKLTSAPTSPALSSLRPAITEHAPLPMAMMEGASHIVRHVNPAFCRLMGKPAARLVGKPFAKLLPKKNGCVALLGRVFRTGKSEGHAEQRRSKPHSVFWSYTVWPVITEKRPVGVMIQVTETAKFHESTVAMNEALVLGSVHQHELTEVAEKLNARLQTEISERKHAEVEVRVSETRYRRLFETAHDGVLLLDPATRKITDANPFMTKLLGYPRSQLIGKELFEIGLLKDEVASQEMFRRLKRTHEVRYEDLPFESQRGRHQEVEVVANLYQENGHSVIQCNIRDITQRKLAEIVLNRLAAIVEFSSDAMIGKDLNSIVTSWNKGAEKIFGYTAREMVGTSIMRLIPTDRRHEEKQILGKIKRGESLENFETLRQTKDGRLIYVSVTVSPIKDATGKVVGVSKVVRDITERKQAEAAQRHMEVLTASNRKLEQEIVRRQAAQESLKKSEQHQRQLLVQSRLMQEQLRNLSHQVLQAQEEERKRISRELHDIIAQTLTGINVRLSTLAREALVNTNGLDRHIASTRRMVEKSVKIVHEFARELRPAVLDDLGLIPALHSFVKLFSKRTRLHIHLKAFAEVEQLDINKRTILYRVAQEALNNVARHAHASRVEVSIQKLPDCICMKITDDGKSFQVERVLNAHGRKRLGLLGMRERLEVVGGRFGVESVQDKGTSIIAQIPIGRTWGGGGIADGVR